MHVHVISPKDNWILQVISQELLKAEGVDFTNSQGIDYDADLNYFINWCYWKILYPNLDKPKKTLVWFTHLDKRNEEYIDVLAKTDHIVAKSLHGKDVLLNRGIPSKVSEGRTLSDKIHVLGGMGTLPGLPYRKIRLGISGRPYKGGRKGEDIIIKLSKDLDSRIFEFIFENVKWLNVISECDIGASIVDNFWDNIDYWLSPSYAEGGPMDCLNATKCGIPIISKDIGFFKELKTNEDIMFTDYSNLLYQLELIQEQRLIKISRMKAHTWDNFRDWHINLFKEINEEQKLHSVSKREIR